MPTVSANGVRLSYQQFGEGPDVILVHGLATNRAFWFLRVARQLQRRFRLTVYDLRGHGLSELTPSQYTVADMAQDLAGLLDGLEIERAALVGHSFGGVVCLKLAALTPQRVERLVVADSRVNSLQPLQRLGDSAHLSDFERDFIAASGKDWNSETQIGLRFLEEVADPRYSDLRSRRRGEFVPFGGIRGSRRTADKWLQLLRTTTASDDFRCPADLPAETIKSVQVPTLLVYGEQSRCLPTREILARLLPNVMSVSVPRSGHFHPASRPGFFVRTVRRFLTVGTVSAHAGAIGARPAPGARRAGARAPRRRSNPIRR
jgi:pimeloyl-ACP methyl ester carboxylesterase